MLSTAWIRLSVLPSLHSTSIKSLTVCILQSGFRRLLFLNGHGGNHVPVSQALSELVCENDQANDAYLVLSTWWETAREVIRKGMITPKLTHACEYETSVILALRPDLVSLDQAREAPMALENEWVQTENEHASRAAIFRRFRRLTATGSMGKQTAASPEKGKRILDNVLAEYVSLSQRMTIWPA